MIGPLVTRSSRRREEAESLAASTLLAVFAQRAAKMRAKVRA